MMTVGRRYYGPSRNWAEACDYCGVMWHRHELIIDGNGLLACPDDQDGMTERELDYQRVVEEIAPIAPRGKTREGPR